MHIVELVVGDVDEARNAAAHVQQRMHLHCRLGRTDMRPAKYRQAQIDRRRVQSIEDCVGQIQAEVLVRVQASNLGDHPLSEVRVDVDSSRAKFVDGGQRRAFDRRAKAHVIELALLRSQTNFDVAQTLPIDQLCESHDAKLLGTGQLANALVATVATDVARNCRPRQKVHQLSEQHLASVHGCLRVDTRKTARTGSGCPNQHHFEMPGDLRQIWLSTPPINLTGH